MKAVIITGSAGSGKSTFIKQNYSKGYTILNSDDIYEQLLISSGLGLNINSFNAEQRSQAASLQAKAHQLTNVRFLAIVERKENIVIDTTGSYPNPLKLKIATLKEQGYSIKFICLYSHPYDVLERNKNRERVLPPSAILKTWNMAYSNIPLYKSLYPKEYFVVDNRNYLSNDYSVEYVKEKYFTKLTDGKTYTLEEKQKKSEELKKQNENIIKILSEEKQFIPTSILLSW